MGERQAQHKMLSWNTNAPGRLCLSVCDLGLLILYFGFYHIPTLDSASIRAAPHALSRRGQLVTVQPPPVTPHAGDGRYPPQCRLRGALKLNDTEYQ